jgi:hypothetical protein
MLMNPLNRLREAEVAIPTVSRKWIVASLVSVVASLMACEDPGQTLLQPDTQVAQFPAANRVGRDPLLLLRQGLTMDERWRAIDLMAGGFAGFHIDEEGNPIISVTRLDACSEDPSSTLSGVPILHPGRLAETDHGVGRP